MPLRGGKLSDWEGGIRVNAFVSGGFVPPAMRGQELDHYIHIADWYSTICAVAGVDANDEVAAKAGLPAVDSINMWPLLSGDANANPDATPEAAATTGPRTEMHISPQTLISGNYKLLTGGSSEFNVPGSILIGLETRFPNVTAGLVPMDGYWAGYGLRSQIDTTIHFRECRNGCLFDITADPYETNDLAMKPGSGKSSPDEDEKMLLTMMARLTELNKDNYEPNRGNQSKLACNAAFNKWGGFYGPFVPGLSQKTSTSTSEPASKFPAASHPVASTTSAKAVLSMKEISAVPSAAVPVSMSAPGHHSAAPATELAAPDSANNEHASSSVGLGIVVFAAVGVTLLVVGVAVHHNHKKSWAGSSIDLDAPLTPGRNIALRQQGSGYANMDDRALSVTSEAYSNL